MTILEIGLLMFLIVAIPAVGYGTIICLQDIYRTDSWKGVAIFMVAIIYLVTVFVLIFIGAKQEEVRNEQEDQETLYRI